MIDSHAHLDFSQYDSDRDDIIHTGFENGLEAVINIGVDLKTSRNSIELAEKQDKIFAVVGVHPHDSKDVPKDYINQLREMAAHPKVVAIGEIGLDYYRDHSPRDIQRRVFEEQLELAKELKKPIVAHIRESLADSFEILEKSGITKGVLHSFPGNSADALKAVEMGFHISFAGPITYPKSDKPEVAAGLPLKRILTETDSPYLTPQAFRGKRNRPEYVKYVIQKLADIFHPYTFDDIERITSRNIVKLFNLPLIKEPAVVYKIRSSLYINLTNRCSCNCYFCPRSSGDKGYVAGHNLFLKKEPTVDEILSEVDKHSVYEEIVFCGLGEPTLRIKELLEIAENLKAKGRKIRLNTNGHGSLINKIDLPPKFVGLIDKISISLNAHNAQTYIELCKPDRGAESYQAMLSFAEECTSLGIAVDMTVVDVPGVDIDSCQQIALDMGAVFKIRRYSL